jgi:uncharacterized protein YbjT (DUF2867 family)
MKRVLMTGATGMIGSLVLNRCLHSDDVAEVIAISRKPLKIVHEKLQEHITHDFKHYNDVEHLFEGIDVAYFCLGVYTGAVSDEVFKEITVDYTKAFAKTLKAKSPNARFSFLSGAGADTKEKSRMAFARYKGMAENILHGLHFDQLSIFRPSYIYPVEKRQEPNFGYRIFRMLYLLFKVLGKNYSITSIQLAKAIYKSGFIKTPTTTLENKDIIDFIHTH